MSLLVLKFGGSSVATPERIRAVAERVHAFREQGNQVVVVVSAMGKTTDGLLSLADEVGALDRREMDQLLATGEQQTIALVSLALGKMGMRARSFTGPQAGFRADGYFMEGRVREIRAGQVQQALDEGCIPVVAGFQAQGPRGDVITLGRGGSDLSAIALAAALEAESCRIYTDVPGIYSADPRVVPGAVKLGAVSWEVCLQMAVTGARVLQGRSAELAARYGMPVYVASSFDREEGTWVMREDVHERLVVQAVTHDLNVAKVAVLGVPDVPGVAARLLTELAEESVGVEMIIQSVMRGDVQDMAFLIRKDLLGEAIDVCRAFSKEIEAQGVTFDTEVARISVVGAGIANHPEVPSQMFSLLAEEGINIDMIASSAQSITCVVTSQNVQEAVAALHRHFVEEALQ
ncbi:MAG: aspartate kinase [Synergistales bacterium]|nr:aspartate kinase [Synergistales bacterium]